jgi:hypothetical protein
MSSSSELYQRYGNDKAEKYKSWALIYGKTDGINYKISKILAK